MIEFLKKFNLPFVYTGNGTFLIGFKNPDFICTDGRKLCLEVANRFHHNEFWEENRIKHFEKYGWKCIVIWWEEIFATKYDRKFKKNWEEELLTKIERFIAYASP